MQNLESATVQQSRYWAQYKTGNSRLARIRAKVFESLVVRRRPIETALILRVGFNPSAKQLDASSFDHCRGLPDHRHDMDDARAHGVIIRWGGRSTGGAEPAEGRAQRNPWNRPLIRGLKARGVSRGGQRREGF